MTTSMLPQLLPLIIPAGGSLLLLVLGAARVPLRFLWGITLFCLAGGLLAIFSGTLSSSPTLAGLLHSDGLSNIFLILLYGAACCVALLTTQSAPTLKVRNEIFFATLLITLTGMGCVVMAAHLASFFLGLEIYSLGLYILIGYPSEHRPALEASVKYFVFGAVSSAFVLLGIAILYLESGTLSLVLLAQSAADPLSTVHPHWLLTGMTCLLVGVGFKLSLVPFHQWAPDVYRGSSTPITLWIATGSKAAIIGFLIYLTAGFSGTFNMGHMLVTVIILSLVIGNLLALFQKNLKKLLAYSSIAHMGYTLVPLSIGGTLAWPAAIVYLTTYLVTVLAAFTFIWIADGESEEAGELDRYRGLAKQSPALSLGIAISFFSLAGIPLTAGFIGKWSIFQSALAAGHRPLVGTIIIGAGLGAFYYLRVIATLYFGAADPGVSRPTPQRLATVLATLATLTIIALGVYPEPLLTHARAITRNLQAPEATPSIMISEGLRPVR